MQKVNLILFILLAMFLPKVASTESQAQIKPLSFMMMTQRLAGDEFWGVVEDIAIAAAKDLGVVLHIRYAMSDRGNMLKYVDEAASKNMDAIIFPNFKKVAPDVFELAEKLKIPVFLFNAGVLAENLQRTGQPREKFKYWIGQSTPDDELAGYQLANILIEQAKQKNYTMKMG
jgi:ABC-type sugar transport system substrate-binding protein